MAIVAKDTRKKYTPAPEGMHQAVCVDVVDHGMQETGFGEKHIIDLRWQINETEPESGKPFLVVNRYNLSLHKKSNLRHHLEAWRGKKFSPEELEGFDLEKLLGINCQLQIIHNDSDNGTTYANVQTIVPIPKSMKKMVSTDYTRFKDRDNGDNKPAPKAEPEPADDDDLPF